MTKRFYKWFFSIPEEPHSWFKVIVWWEIRRIPYNLIIGVVGFISLLLFFLFIHLAKELKPGEDAIEPLALLAAPFIINLCYTAGWPVELILRLFRHERKAMLGPILLRLGVLLSLVVVLLPSVIWFLIWIIRSI
jgi:hypothetical protein